MYTPLKTDPKERISRIKTITPYGGENFRQYTALLQPTNALLVENYLPDAEGRLPKRKGLQKIFEVAGTDSVTLLKRYNDTYWIFGYGTTIAAWNQLTDSITTIKSDFSANDGFYGAVYGDYFFVVNGVDKLQRIFTDLTITAVNAAPVAKRIVVFGARLILGNLAANPNSVQYSEIDDGTTNPPFTAWNTGTTGTNGGIVSYRKAKEVQDIVSMGNNVVVFSDVGKWAFTIDLSNTNGTITKIDDTVMDKRDLGGKRAIVTRNGIYYVNKSGIWNMVSLGQPNIPFSQQEGTITYILGREYFPDIDFTSSDLAFDDINQLLYVTCRRKGSPQNNFVIVYNASTKAFGRITGWNINRFFVDTDGVIWGGSSSFTRVYKCFQGYDDDGLAINTTYYQELTSGDFQTNKAMEKFAIQSDIAKDTQITIQFDTFDYQARFVPNTASFLFTATNTVASGGGYGVQGYGTGSYGTGGVLDPSTISMFDSYKPGFRNFQRVFVKIISADYSPHSINMFIADIQENKDIRKRNITVINN